MKKSVIAIIALACACVGSSFAACGTPLYDPDWCRCFKTIMVDRCKLLGGGESSCNDKSIRNYVKQVGGPERVCLLSPPEMQQECLQELPMYLNSCVTS